MIGNFNQALNGWEILCDQCRENITGYVGQIDRPSDEQYFGKICARCWSDNNSGQPSSVEIDFATLQYRSEAMYEYMLNQLGQTAAFRTFCADVDALNTQYLTGSLALVAFIRSVNDAIWGNYSTTGFISKGTYRGTAVGGVFPRQTAILAILQP